MNLDPLSFALAEISYALKNLNKNNFKANASEINQLVNNFGFEADRHLIKCLYNQVDFLDGRNLGKDLYQIHYLNQDYNNFINKPNFASLICNAIEAILKENKNVNIGQLLNNLSKISKLSRVQEIAYGLSLFHSTNLELKEYTKTFLKQKVPEFLQSYIEGSSHQDGLHDIAVEILHLLLTNLLNGQEDQFGIGTEQIEAFLAALRKDFPPDRVPVVLAPLIYQKVVVVGSPATPARDLLPLHKLTAEIPAITKTMVDVSKLVMELGYAFCSGPPEDCQSHLIQIGVHEMTPASVARILGMMATTHTNLSDAIPLYSYTANGDTSWVDPKDKSDAITTWNTEVFVNAVKEVVPHFHWRDVVYELDQAGLVIKDKQGLKLIVQAIFQGLESNTETFPVDFFYRSWNHSEEQLSWLESIVNNPDVFCFADYPSKQVSTDILKLSPEDESDRKIHTWKSLDMIEALLKLSERGHYQRVQELFKFPLQNCRDILTLGLLQIKGPLTLLGQDLLATLLPHALANNSNSLIVLQIAWHSQYHSNITRTLIMHSMAEWYMKDPNDQSRLSRILDIAQDLKALSLLLNCTPFGFIVDLACLASRREYLKLEKWLGEKIREHGETFIWALIAFMRRRCPQVLHLLASGSSPFSTSAGNACGKEDRFLGGGGSLNTPPTAPIPKSLQLPPEIMNVIVNSLQTFVASMLQPAQAIGHSGSGQGQPLTAHPLLKASMYPGSSSGYRSGSGSIGPQTGNALSPELCDTLGTLLVGLAPSRTQKHQLAAILQQQQHLHQNASMLIAGPGLNALANSNPVLGNSNAPMHHPQRLLGAHLPSAGPGLNQQPGRHHVPPYESASGFAPGPGLYEQTQTHSRSSLLNPLAQLLPPDLPPDLDFQSGPGMKAQGSSGGQQPNQQLQGTLSTSVSSVSALLDLLNNMGVGSGAPGSDLGPKPPSTPTPNTGGPGSSVNNANNNTNMDMATVFPSFDALARAMGHTVSNAGETAGLMGNSKSAPQQNITGPNQITQSTPTSISAQANLLSVDLSAMFPDMNMSSFGKDIEDEANAYFQRIYNRPPHPTMCLDDFLAMLKRFRDSPEQREKEVFACMLRNLFEEYRFFSTYPEKELHITSCLFGGLVEKGICNYVGLSIALRFVLEALRKPKEDKMRFFGTTALDTFKELLKDYSQYCSHILQIPHFSEFPAYLREYVECGARGQEVSLANKVSAPNPSKSFTPPPQNTQTSTPSANFSSTTPAISQQTANPSAAPTLTAKSTAFDGDGQSGNAEAKEEILVPSEMVQDKLAFIFNNLSQANINQKTEEVMELMVDENLPWVSRYLVMKRASIENNFHNLYANFLDCIRIPRLNNLVIQETFRNIKILMKSDKAAGNFSDRSLLKNLGHWLGLLTIAKSKPLLQSEIDVKHLILEAAVKGTQELLYGIPFVAKILESCSRSKVFKPPNPWTMAIMNLLAEIHKEPEMKLNLKFEIEMLCKTLNLDINSLGRSTNILASYRNKLAAAAAVASAATQQQASTLAGVPEDAPHGSAHPSGVSLPAQATFPGPRGAAPPSQPPAPTPGAAAAAASFFNMIMMQQAQAQNDASAAAAQQQQQLLATLLSNLGAGGATPALFQQQLQQMLAAASQQAPPQQQQPQSGPGHPGAPTPQNLTIPPKKGPPGSGYNSASSTPHPPSGMLSNASSAVQPQFHYNDINVSSGFAGILPYIQINSQIPLFQLRPQLRQLVRLALERSIQEILPPLAERVLKITLASAESLIKKDFALDPEEGRMRAAAHHLVRFLAGGISLYTVREPLFASLLTNFKSAFTIGLRGTTSLSNPVAGASSSSTPLHPFESEGGNTNTTLDKLSNNSSGFMGPQTGAAVGADKDIKELMHLIEHAANCLAGDNFELACCFAQKTTIERAVVEIDRRLGGGEYEIRKLARTEHRRYWDPLVLTYQVERLPEQIRLKVGGVTPNQAMVYEVFSRNIPGFVPNSAPRDLSLGAFGNLSTSMLPPPPNFYPKLHPGTGAAGISNLTGPSRALFDGIQPNLGVTQARDGGLLTGDDLQARILDKLASELEQGLISLGSATASLARINLNETTNPRPQEPHSPDNNENGGDGSSVNENATTPNQLLAPLLRSLLETSILVRNVASVAAPESSATLAQSLVNKCMDSLFESCYLNQHASAPEINDLASKFRDAYILVLKAIQDPRTFGPQWANKHITKYLIETKEESRFNLEAISSLITNRLINIQQYDTHLSHSMENGLNYVAVAFGMQLVKRFCLDERDAFPLSESDFYKTIDALTSVLAHSRQAPPDLASLMERIKNETDINLLDRGPVLYSAMFHSGISAAKEFDDPPGLQDKVEFLFREWLNIYNSPSLSKDLHAAINSFMMQMHQQGIFKTDDLITRFFRICTEVCVESCYRTLQPGSSHLLPITVGTAGDNSSLLMGEENKARLESRRVKCYQNVDAYVKLIALLIKHSNQSENNGTQVNLLNKVLGIFVGLLVQHHKNPPTGNVFLPLPFHRLFAILYSEIIGMSSMFDSHAVQIVTAFCNAYHVLRPIELPGFCFSWLELIAHRNFLAKTLAYAPQSKVWNHYSELLTDIFKFLAPYLRNVDLPKSLLHFYNGCLRLLLVLLHDFPEFLCDFHYGFCDVIPPNCVQMRNLVLSAFPRNMRLPDPFTPNLKVDLLPEIRHSPRVTTNFGAVLTSTAPEFKQLMDTYLKTRSPVTFLTDIRSNLQENPSPGSHYNISLVNALVLYVGTQAISSIQSQGLTPGLTTITHSSHMDVFQNLAVGLDSEGRYLFLNAIANQLRYPNSHTHYFSCILLHLFGEANTEAIQEQITRVLLERLIVNRPHPWGLLITFIELIKNASFNFWDHDFVRCAPEIEKLFDSVSKSCMQAKPQILIQSRENQGAGRLPSDMLTSGLPSNNEMGGDPAVSGIDISMTNLSL